MPVTNVRGIEYIWEVRVFVQTDSETILKAALNVIQIVKTIALYVLFIMIVLVTGDNIFKRKQIYAFKNVLMVTMQIH
jgi:hypothetical protein